MNLEILHMNQQTPSEHKRLIRDLIWKEWGSHYFSSNELKLEIENFSQEDSASRIFYAIDSDGTVCGTISFLENDLDLFPEINNWLANFYVIKKYRKQGVGKALYENLLSYATRRGYKDLYIYTEDTSYYSSKSWKIIKEFAYKNRNNFLMRLEFVSDKTKKNRCFGEEENHSIYAKYHDTEWGVPVHDDTKLFEMLVLEGAQAGLSWETILKKRSGYRDAFYNFDVQKVASMSDRDLLNLCKNSAIIRNRLKIFSARSNARIFLEIQTEFGSFSKYVWGFVGGKQVENRWASKEFVPVSTLESIKLSKDLKERGMKFVGPTIMYAYMQSVGLVNDHLETCWLYKE